MGKYLNRYPFGRGPVHPSRLGPLRGEGEPDGCDRLPRLPRRRPGFAACSCAVTRRIGSPNGRSTSCGPRPRPSRSSCCSLRAPRTRPGSRPPGTRAPSRSSTSRSLRRSRARCAARRPGCVPCRSRAPRSAPPGSTISGARTRRCSRSTRRSDGIVTALGDRLDDTVIFVLSDNGYSFGEHRWEGKTCPYDACVRIPLAVYTPGVRVDRGTEFVSIVDLAPTILDLADAPPIAARDGTSFAATLTQGASRDSGEADPVFLEWAGDDRIPAWRSVRTADFTLIRYADGFEELYDLRGRFGPADPWESTNRARRSARRGRRTAAPGAPGSRPGARLDWLDATGADHPTCPPGPRPPAATDVRSTGRRPHRGILAWQFWPSAGKERGTEPRAGRQPNGSPSRSPGPPNADCRSST